VVNALVPYNVHTAIGVQYHVHAAALYELSRRTVVVSRLAISRHIAKSAACHGPAQNSEACENTAFHTQSDRRPSLQLADHELIEQQLLNVHMPGPGASSIRVMTTVLQPSADAIISAV
jgi:hypothetical protein